MADCCLERLVANSMPSSSFPLPHLGSLPTRSPGVRGAQLPAAVRSRACPGRTPGTDLSPSHAASVHGPPLMVRSLGQPPPAMYQRSPFASMLALPLTVRLTLAVPDNRRCLRQGGGDLARFRVPELRGVAGTGVVIDLFRARERFTSSSLAVPTESDGPQDEHACWIIRVLARPIIHTGWGNSSG